MQNQRTLQFWDDYYSSQDKGAQEWILEPTIELLERLAEHIPPHTPSLRILEIGCGTSALARELWIFLIRNNIDAHVMATDISPVCIHFNQQRDRITQHPSSSSSSSLEYRILNAAEQQPDFQNHFDIILDKGCLDTFAFRSKQRGHRQSYAPLIRTVLNNIHAWLKHDGVYWVLTPRHKLKSARDFRGFKSVQRVDVSAMRRGELVATREHTFLHVCSKNVHYSPIPGEQAFDVEDDKVDGTCSCQTCFMTFYDFRKGECLDGKGEAVWLRQWKGHCQHCKGIANS